MDGYKDNRKGPASIHSKASKENLKSFRLMLPYI